MVIGSDNPLARGLLADWKLRATCIATQLHGGNAREPPEGYAKHELRASPPVNRMKRDMRVLLFLSNRRSDHDLTITPARNMIRALTRILTSGTTRTLASALTTYYPPYYYSYVALTITTVITTVLAGRSNASSKGKPLSPPRPTLFHCMMSSEYALYCVMSC